MTDVKTNARSPAPNVVSEYRDMGDNTKAPVVAAVNIWPVSDDGVQIDVSASASAATALPDNGGAISILARGGAVRFKLGDGTVAATAISNLVDDGERLDLLLKTGQTHISAIGDDGVTEATLDIMGLGQPDEDEA